jgi:hypothetical protein
MQGNIAALYDKGCVIGSIMCYFAMQYLRPAASCFMLYVRNLYVSAFRIKCYRSLFLILVSHSYST